MKIKYFHIFCLLLSGFVFSFDTCSTTDREEESDDNRTDSVSLDLIREFSSDYLLEDQLLVLGEKGKQKTRDFFDYLTLYPDNKLEPVFRDQLQAAMLKCFSPGNDLVLLWPVKLPYASHISEWLALLKMTGFTCIKYEITGLKIIEPLHRVSNERYIGQLNGTLTISALSGTDTIYSESSSKYIGIEVVKIRKSFGPDEHQVWQVFLSGVN